MEVSYQSPDCKDHPSKKVIAVCLTPGCQTNLCDSCFANHSMHHAQLGTHMQLTSLEDLWIQAHQKLESTISEAKTRKESFDLFANTSGPESLKTEINQIRSIVVQLAMDYFDDLEKKVSLMTSESSQNRESQRALFEKEINRFIQNLHLMADNLTVKNSMIKTLLLVKQRDFRCELDLIHEKCSLPFESTALKKNPSFESSLMNFFATNIQLTKLDSPPKKKDPYQVDIESEDIKKEQNQGNIFVEHNKKHEKNDNDDAAQQESEDSSNKIQCNQQ